MREGIFLQINKPYFVGDYLKFNVLGLWVHVFTTALDQRLRRSLNS